MNLQGKVALVTGSTSGIGRAIALNFAAAGANVVLHGRRPEAACEDLLAEVARLGRQARYLQADISLADVCSSLVDRAWSTFGSIDIWVNNAGADVLTGAIRDASFSEKLELLWRTDVVPTLLFSRDAGRRMREHARASGEPAGTRSILNIGWNQAAQGMAGDSGELFGASKGAVMAATRALAQSLAPEVRVNCIAPGWIRTAWGHSASEAWQTRAMRESLMGRWGTPEDIAQLATFLTSPQANFISGEVISACGGFRFNPLEP
jgi:3-oxoacyl-[acyl-carrier protein] reductase